jgi:hypothetical protein
LGRIGSTTRPSDIQCDAQTQQSQDQKFHSAPQNL